MGFDLSLLGVQKNIPKVNFKEYTGIFSAPEKFGKTTFAALYPNSIIVAAEVGYKAQVVNYRNVEKWTDFIEFVNLLAKNRKEIGNSVQTIIIDTAEKLYAMVTPYIVKKASIEDQKVYKDLKDIPYGQGFGMVDREFEKQINRIISMGFTLLYLTHTMVKTIKPKNGEPYDVYKSTMPDRCASIIYPACDYIIYGERRKVETEDGEVLKRVITTRGSDDLIAGNRVYFDDDIIFDTEEEAMEKFQIYFQEGIKRNLEKAGIKTSIEELAKQQEKERQKAIEQYMEIEQEEIEELSKDDLKKQIAKLISNLNEEVSQEEVGNRFKEILGIKNYTKAEDVKKLQKVIDYLKTLPTK